MKDQILSAVNLKEYMPTTQMKLFNFDAKPFLKWAGGKGQLIPELVDRLPNKFKKSMHIPVYIEPFIGGGAFFFYLQSCFQIDKSILIDINRDLIITYQVIKYAVENLIALLSELDNKYNNASQTERTTLYYDIRKRFNYSKKHLDTTYNELWIRHTAYMIFLNRTCFNGLYRENKNGEFNVPHGRYDKPSICQAENLWDANKALSNTKILQGDFSLAANYVEENTLIYYDPPYRPLTKTSNFNSYAKEGFADKDQIRLANFFKDMDRPDVYQILSNSDPRVTNPEDDFFDNLYKEYKISRIQAKRMINSDAEKRGNITEIIVKNY